MLQQIELLEVVTVSGAILGLVLNLIVLPFTLYLALLAISAFFSRRNSLVSVGAQNIESNPSQRVYFTFVIPAHNEESGIADTVQSCLEVNYPREAFEVIVIADNCSDRTAFFASQAGAKTFERFDDEKKSKGYALEWYFEKRLSEFEGTSSQRHAFVVVDADSLVAKNLLAAFETDIINNKHWVQCRYDVRNPLASEQTKLLTYALSLFNGIWLWGQDAIKLGSALRGNGMCFEAQALRRFPMKAYGLTEDLEFSWHLRLAGERVFFNATTSVYGEMVSKKGPVAERQRLRWEQGRKSLCRLFRSKISSSEHLTFLQKQLCRIDLFSFPLAKTVSLASGGFFVSAIVLIVDCFAKNSFDETNALRTAILPTFSLAFLNLICLAVYLISPFILFKLPLDYILALLKAPKYILWKIFLAARNAFKKKDDTWVRTDRETK
jgi:glycosyltransferase involved in cell wall biosynthesis